MASNAERILGLVLEQKRAELFPEMSSQDFFEIFCASQALKDNDLSYDDIQEGIVDGEHDGGIDSVYCFIDGHLLREDHDFSSVRRGAEIDLYVIQSKTAGGFSEVPIDKMISVTRKLLKLSVDYSEFPELND